MKHDLFATVDTCRPLQRVAVVNPVTIVLSSCWGSRGELRASRSGCVCHLWCKCVADALVTLKHGQIVFHSYSKLDEQRKDWGKVSGFASTSCYRELPRFTLSRHHLLQRAIARELGSTLRWSRHNVAHCYIGCADWIQCNLDFSLLFWAKRNQLGYVNHSFGETWDLPNFQNNFLTENPWHMEESISKLAPGVRALTGSLNLHQRGKR